METPPTLASASNVFPTSLTSTIIKHPNPAHLIHYPLSLKRKHLTSTTTTSSAVSDVSSIVTSDPAQVQVTWQIVVGSVAGVTPFVVAGIEFSKRIMKQKKCEVCGGSGLVLRDKKYYFRCPGCGGFLPWQSWRRFFTG